MPLDLDPSENEKKTRPISNTQAKNDPFRACLESIDRLTTFSTFFQYFFFGLVLLPVVIPNR